ncbi:MAG: hypothetical protein GKR89_31440 [Candidatus Latescibacteria bacterium]|nr:hypothetical protein [Candidatus Latescibacterota bacterium]
MPLSRNYPDQKTAQLSNGRLLRLGGVAVGRWAGFRRSSRRVTVGGAWILANESGRSFVAALSHAEFAARSHHSANYLPAGLSVRALAFLAVLVWLGLASSAQGHNGRLALAQSFSDIVVDGDLSDWPVNRVRYAIDRSAPFPSHWRGAGETAADTSADQAWFSIGYEATEEALYIAVEVRDETVRVDSVAGEVWNSRDGCEVFLASPHQDDGAPVQYVLWGRDPVARYDRGIKIEVLPAGVQVQARRGAGMHHYEWRLTAQVLGVSNKKVVP